MDAPNTFEDNVIGPTHIRGLKDEQTSTFMARTVAAVIANN